MKKILFGLLLCWLSATQLVAQLPTGYGVNYTPQERELWKQRSANGPYKTKSDYSTNSPGDWDRIAANSEKFNSNPSAGRYRIQPTATSCVQPTTVALSPEDVGHVIRDAGFYYLIKSDAGGAEQTKALVYASKVRAELLAQMNERRDNANPSSQRLFDFANTLRWCSGEVDDLPPNFYMAAWMERLRQAYDYTKGYSGYTNDDHTALRAWFSDAATYFSARSVDYYLNRTFLNRAAGNYTINNGRTDYFQYHATDQLYYGSTKLVNISRSYNNRRGEQMAFVAAVGVMNNNATFKASAKLFFQEVMRFAAYPLGTINGRPYCLLGELERGSDASPEQGWQYSMVMLNQLVRIADAFARSGDTTLYSYSTTTGPLSLGGGEKSLKNIIYGYSCLQDRTLDIYCTTQSGRNGNPAYRIDGFDPVNIPNRAYVMDSWVAPANRYYASKDGGFSTRLNKIYLRKAYGTYAWTAYPSGAGGSNPWTGSFGGGAPAYLLMYGDTEESTSNNFFPSTPVRYDVTQYHLEKSEVSSTYLGYNSSFLVGGDSIRLSNRWVSAKSASSDTATLYFTVPVRIDTMTIATGIPSFNQLLGITTRYAPDRNIRVQYYASGAWTQFYSVDNNRVGLITIPANISSCTRIRYIGVKMGGADYTRVGKIYLIGAAN